MSKEKDIVASLMLLAFGTVLVLMPGWSAVTAAGYALEGLGFWNLLVLKAFKAKGK